MTPLSPRTLLLVASGGALGSVLRYLIGVWLPPATGGLAPGIPIGTLLVNVTGAFLIGVVTGVMPPLAGGDRSLEWLRLAVATGFCGGFTTFSALSAETLALLTAGRTGRAVVYMALTLLLGLTATWMGLRMSTALGPRLPRVTPFP